MQLLCFVNLNSGRVMELKCLERIEIESIMLVALIGLNKVTQILPELSLAKLSFQRL